MADFRQIHTQIWKDEWFMDLSNDGKLLFIYLFSNENSNMAGIYKLPLRVAEFETGLSKDTIQELLNQFEIQERAVYRDGIVWVVHMRRYHSSESGTVLKNITASLEIIPECLIKKAYTHYQDKGKFSLDTLCISYAYDTDMQSLKEDKREEEKREEISLAPESFAASIYNGIAGGAGLPMSERDDITSACLTLMGKYKTVEAVKEYAKPFYDAFIVSKPKNKSRAYWLTDWALTGQMPEINGNGKPQKKISAGMAKLLEEV